MPLPEFIKQAQRRLIPTRGMVIDVPTWSAAHGYHASKQRIHNLSGHSFGILTGLDVTETPTDFQSVTVHPGIAVDKDGNQIVLPEPETLDLSSSSTATIYVLLQYREIDEIQRTIVSQDEKPSSFTVEGYRLLATDSIPDNSYIELARILISGDRKEVRNPIDHRIPNANEIDHRFRNASRSGTIGSLRYALMSLPGSEDTHPVHTKGIMSLTRSINSLTNYSTSLEGYLSPGEERSDIDLVFLSGIGGFDVSELLVSDLSKHLSTGGILFGEACSSDNGETGQTVEFKDSFKQLTDSLNRQFEPVSSDNPILHSMVPFGTAPDGVNGSGAIVSSGDIIYSDNDYGCLWEGKQDHSRTMIRDAIEMGMNIAVYASEPR